MKRTDHLGETSKTVDRSETQSGQVRLLLVAKQAADDGRQKIAARERQLRVGECKRVFVTHTGKVELQAALNRIEHGERNRCPGCLALRNTAVVRALHLHLKDAGLRTGRWRRGVDRLVRDHRALLRGPARERNLNRLR